MKSWIRVRAGDSVYIVAPAGMTDAEPSRLDWVCNFLRDEWDLNPRVSTNIFGKSRKYYRFANSHAERAADFTQALQSDATAIFTLRGGYGSNWIAEALIRNPIPRPNTPKLFVGFSDVTTLHALIHRLWDWPSIHGLSRSKEHLQSLKRLLFGEIDYVEFALEPLNSLAKTAREIETRVVGGNLAVVQAGWKTPWEVCAAGRIVLLEDIGEAPYRIARMLHHLHAGGFFAEVHAVLIGDLLYSGQGKSEEQIQTEMDDVVEEFAEYAVVPVLRRRGIGHGPINDPIPLNTRSRLILGANPQLVVS